MTIVFNMKMGQLQGKYVLKKCDIEYLSKHTQMTKKMSNQNQGYLKFLCFTLAMISIVSP